MQQGALYSGYEILDIEIYFPILQHNLYQSIINFIFYIFDVKPSLARCDHFIIFFSHFYFDITFSYPSHFPLSHFDITLILFIHITTS
jgi:hypothetical protein